MEVIAFSIYRDVGAVIEGVTDVGGTSNEVIAVDILRNKLATQYRVTIIEGTSHAIITGTVRVGASCRVKPATAVGESDLIRITGVVCTDDTIITKRIIIEELTVEEPVTFVVRTGQ